MSKIIGVVVNSITGQELNYMVVSWNGESTKDYSHIQCKIMTSSGIYVNTVTKAITSSVSNLPIYLLQDGIKPNTEYKLTLTGMKDNEVVGDSTSDEVSFTTPANIGQVQGTVFNLYGSPSNSKEQGYRNNFLFNVGFALIQNVFLLNNHLEYKMTVQNKTTKEIKTIDVQNGTFYSLYNIFTGAITAGEYKFEFFYRIRVGANIYDSDKRSATSTYDADTRPSLKPQSFSITVKETYRQQCNIKLVYDNEVASNSFNKLLKVYKGSVLKFTKVLKSNTDSFFPHDGQYNLDGNNTYTAIVETSRTITDPGITETATSNQTTFFLSEWRAPAAPTGLYIDTNKVLHWGAIENATSYMVSILGNNYSTEKNFYDLKQTALKDYIGQVNITVTANNDAGVATSAPCVYINRPIPITGIRVSNLDRTSKQITFSWNPQIQYSYTIIYRLYINNTLIADNLTNTSYTFDYNNYFKDGGRYVIAVDSLVNGVGSQPVSSFTYTYKEIEVEKDAIKKAKIKINEMTTTPEYPISVNAEDVIVEYNDGTHENVQVVLEDKAERSLYQDDKIDLGGSSSKQHGVYSASIGTESLASGSNSIAVGDAAHAEGLNSSSFGNGTYAKAESSHVEGQGTSTTENAKYAHAEGWATKASGVAAHAEGYDNRAETDYSHAEGQKTVASGLRGHAEGMHTSASGENSHAEGYFTSANGKNSHAEGQSILVHGGDDISVALQANGAAAHAEGCATKAYGDYSHAEGMYTYASGTCSHAEGSNSEAIGNSSHAGGYKSSASAPYSFCHGRELRTVGIEPQAAFGCFNETNSSMLFSIGNGSSDTDRKNAFSINKSGTMTFNSNVLPVYMQDFIFGIKGKRIHVTKQSGWDPQHVNQKQYILRKVTTIDNPARQIKAKVKVPDDYGYLLSAYFTMTPAGGGYANQTYFFNAEQFSYIPKERCLDIWFLSTSTEGLGPNLEDFVGGYIYLTYTSGNMDYMPIEN